MADALRVTEAEVHALRREVLLAEFRATDATVDWTDYDPTVYPDDTDIFGTVLEVFGGSFGYADARTRTGARFGNLGPLTEAEWTIARDQAIAVLNDGFEHLSPYGHEHLDPVLEELRRIVEWSAFENTNPADLWQAFMEHHIDAYKDWEFARLARTEAQFARIAAQGQYYRDTFGAAGAALRSAAESFNLRSEDVIPIHPNCMCSMGMVEGEDGVVHLMVEPNPTACDFCFEVADDIMGTALGDAWTGISPEDIADEMAREEAAAAFAEEEYLPAAAEVA